MSLLHRHIFLSVLGSCAAAVGLFGFVLIVGNMLKDLLPFVLAGQIPIETFFRLLFLLVPFVCAYALPMGILTGVLLVLGRMSAQNEVTAMRAAGLSLGYIARPILILGLLGSATAAYVNFSSMPRARTAYKKLLADAVQKNPLSFIIPETFIRDFPGVVLFASQKVGRELKDVWLWQLDKQERVRRSGRAVSGDVRFDETESKLMITLHQFSGEARNKDNPEDFTKAPEPQTGVSDELTIELPLARIFGKQSVKQKPTWMTWDELHAERKRLSEIKPAEAPADLALQRIRVECALNEKAATALSVLAFAVLAVPLGIKVSRKETSANLGVALLLVMGYYFLTICLGWFDRRPELRPDLLLWAPAVSFLALGGWLFRRMGRV